MQGLWLLFFRHRTTPTANKLQQLVRKMSMNSLAEMLSRFWETLPKKSWLRIEHPDSAYKLRDVAGEVITALWQRSQALADKSLAVTRSETQVMVLATQAAADAAKTQAEAARHSFEEVQERLRTAEGLSRATKQGQVDSGAPVCRVCTVAALHFWQMRKV